MGPRGGQGAAGAGAAAGQRRSRAASSGQRAIPVHRGPGISAHSERSCPVRHGASIPLSGPLPRRPPPDRDPARFAAEFITTWNGCGHPSGDSGRRDNPAEPQSCVGAGTGNPRRRTLPFPAAYFAIAGSNACFEEAPPRILYLALTSLGAVPGHRGIRAPSAAGPLLADRALIRFRLGAGWSARSE